MRRILTILMVLPIIFSSVGLSIAKENKYRMIFIVKSLDNPFWNMMIAGAKNAANDLGIEIEGLGPVKPFNVEEQIRFIEDAITKGVDAVVVVPADSRGILPGIEKARKAGLVVVTPNTRAFADEPPTWTGVENEGSAYEIAKYILKTLKGKGNVIILEGASGNQTVMDRKKGFDRAIKEFPEIKVLASQTAKSSRVEGMRVMENLLQQFPEINAVLAANDEMALGAIEAIDAAGRIKEIKVSGFDMNNDALKSISEGRLLVTGAQRPEAQAYWAVVAAYISLKGMPIPKDIFLPCPIVDKSNIDYYLKLAK
jgi:ribose transport system substrate-binding protein